MKSALSTTSAIIGIFLASCAATRPPASSAPPSWVHEPAGGTALQADWWKAFGDPGLDDLIARGWNANPEIESALQRVEAARADRFEAMAALFPKVGLAAGFREGREQNRMTNYRPDDLEPWTASGELSWEIDLTGKLGARLAAAKAAEGAAHARWRGARLMIATEIALARFEDLVLSSEIGIQQAQLASEEKAVGMTEALLQRGLVSSGDRSMSVSGAEAMRRELSELERLRSLARLRLDRLCGGDTGSTTVGDLPVIPPSPAKSPAAVWGSRPDLVAAEAELRAAFAAQDAAHLDLLPTLSLGAGGNLGTNSLSGQLRTWELSAGPRLEIPVWDPGRIATLKRSKAAAAGSAADYRATALKAVEEIEGAYLNFTRRRSQLQSIEREQATTRTAWIDTRAKTKSGAGSFPDENLAGRRYREVSRAASRLRLQLLDDYLALVRALGG
jgi:NodT family efflux transporter outer membrane factor (OMF) lipoprotein